MTLLSIRPDPHPIAAVLDTPAVVVAARILLTAPFWMSGLLKLFDFSSAMGEAAAFGLRPFALMAAIVIVVQLSGSIAVIADRWTWLGAGVLGVFTALANIVGHAFWTIPDATARFHDMNAFLANTGLIGGLVLAAALADRQRRR